MYLAPTGLGEVYKLSVHAASPVYYFGLTEEEARRQGGIKRDLIKWKRRPVPRRGDLLAAHVVCAYFPTDYLGRGKGTNHKIHWIPAAPNRSAIQIDLIITEEAVGTIEAAFKSNGRRLEEFVLLPNGHGVAVVSSRVPEWQNEDFLLRGGPDFANVAFLADDPKGGDRSEIIILPIPPKDGGPLVLRELWGNHVPADFRVPFGTGIITGGPGAVSSASRKMGSPHRDSKKTSARMH